MQKPLVPLLTNDNHRQALERDFGMCVLTCEPQPGVAHIIPYSFGRHAGPLDQTTPNIMAFLHIFAGPDAVNNINNYLMRPTAYGRGSQINRVENLLSLAPNIHQRFGSGNFVLEPVGDPLEALRDNDVLRHTRLASPGSQRIVPRTSENRIAGILGNS